MPTGTQNGVGILKNITFEHTSSPPYIGEITADAQLLIGSITSNPDIAMKAGVLKSDDGSITFTYDEPDLNIELTNPADVTGPGSSTDNAVVRWDGTTGKIIQNSVGILSDAGDLTNLLSLEAGNIRISGNTVEAFDTNGDLNIGPDGTGKTNVTTGNFNLAADSVVEMDGTRFIYRNDLRSTFLGINSGSLTSTASDNTGIGHQALNSITTGTFNTAVGSGALSSVTVSGGNTAVGHDALAAHTTGNNTAVGFRCLQSVAGASGNTAVGYQSVLNLVSAGNVTAVGHNVLNATTAGLCTGVGHSALESCTTGVDNTGIGADSLRNITTGGYNTALGDGAGNGLATSDSSNILIKNAGTSGDNNTLRIGEQGTGNGEVDTAFIAGIVGNTVSNAVPVMINTSTGQLGEGDLPGIYFIEAQSASNSASIEFTGLPSYDVYLLTWETVRPATDGSYLTLEISDDDGSTWETTNYQGGCLHFAFNSTTGTSTNSTSHLPLSGPIDNATSVLQANGSAKLFTMNTGNRPYISGNETHYDNTAGATSMGIIGGSTGFTGVEAFRFLMSAGNITAGTFRVYGLVNS